MRHPEVVAGTDNGPTAFLLTPSPFLQSSGFSPVSGRKGYVVNVLLCIVFMSRKQDLCLPALHKHHTETTVPPCSGFPVLAFLPVYVSCTCGLVSWAQREAYLLLPASSDRLFSLDESEPEQNCEQWEGLELKDHSAHGGPGRGLVTRVLCCVLHRRAVGWVVRT